MDDSATATRRSTGWLWGCDSPIDGRLWGCDSPINGWPCGCGSPIDGWLCGCGSRIVGLVSSTSSTRRAEAIARDTATNIMPSESIEKSSWLM